MEARTTVSFAETDTIPGIIRDRIRRRLRSSKKTQLCIGIPGGRTARLIIEAVEELEPAEIAKLTFILVDERLSGERNLQSLLDFGLQKLIDQGLFDRERLVSTELLIGRQLPEIDLLLLGIGEDGHFASLFPGSYPQLDGPEVPDAAEISGAPKPPPERVSLTYRGLRRAAAHAQVVLIITGNGKQAALRRLLASEDPRTLPAAFLVREIGTGAEIITDITEEQKEHTS